MSFNENYDWLQLHPWYGGLNPDGILTVGDTGYMRLISDFISHHGFIDLPFKKILEQFITLDSVYDKNYVRAAAWLSSGDAIAEDYLSSKIVVALDIPIVNALVALPFFREPTYSHRLVSFIEGCGSNNNVVSELSEAIKYVSDYKSQDLIVSHFIDRGYHRQAETLLNHINFPRLKQSLEFYIDRPDNVRLRRSEDRDAALAQIAFEDIEQGLVTKSNIDRIIKQNDLYMISEVLMYVKNIDSFSKDEIISFQSPLVFSLYNQRDSFGTDSYRAAAFALPYVFDYDLQTYLVNTIMAKTSSDAKAVALDAVQYVRFQDLRDNLKSMEHL